MAWRLSDVIMSDLNRIGWSWQRLCIFCHGVTTSVRALWRFSYHIHNIVSELCCHFLIDSYGIFPSLRCTISYSRTMSAYEFLISVFSPSVSTLYYVFYPSVSTLYLIPYLFDPTLTKFPTCSLVMVVSSVGYLRFPPHDHVKKNANRDLCRDFIKKPASMCSLLHFTIGIFIYFNPVISKEITYIDVTGVPSAWIVPVLSYLLHSYYPGKKVLLNVISLCSHKQTIPNVVW